MEEVLKLLFVENTIVSAFVLFMLYQAFLQYQRWFAAYCKERYDQGKAVEECRSCGLALVGIIGLPIVYCIQAVALG